MSNICASILLNCICNLFFQNSDILISVPDFETNALHTNKFETTDAVNNSSRKSGSKKVPKEKTIKVIIQLW